MEEQEDYQVTYSGDEWGKILQGKYLGDVNSRKIKLRKKPSRQLRRKADEGERIKSFSEWGSKTQKEYNLSKLGSPRHFTRRRPLLKDLRARGGEMIPKRCTNVQ